MRRTVVTVRNVRVVTSAIQPVAHALGAVPRTVFVTPDACIKVRRPYYTVMVMGVLWEGVVGIAACHEADEFAVNFAKFVAVEQGLRLPVLIWRAAGAKHHEDTSPAARRRQRSATGAHPVIR